MIKKIICLLCLSTGLTAWAQTDTYLFTDFNEGLPSGFTTKDYDENPVTNSDYKPSRINESWSVYMVDTPENQSAISASRGENDSPVNNWLITPSVRITAENAWLIWDAKAINYDFRDGYKVMISTTDQAPESFSEVFSIQEEDYNWVHHFVSLESYQGKDIYVAFVNNSQNKYILAIDNLFIGIPAPGEFEVIDETSRFVGNIGTTTVKGGLKNLGGPVNLKQLDCVLNDGQILKQEFNDIKLLPGQIVDFSFEIPVIVNQITSYTLKVTTDVHTNKEVLRDSVACSNFPLTLISEEYTGTWCNECPKGTLYMNMLKKRYKDQIITITGHNNDPMAYPIYESGLNRWIFNLPGFIHNRNSSTVYSPQPNYSFMDKGLAELITKPVNAMIELTAAYDDKDHKSIKTQATASFAENFDNSADRYKLGYTLIEKTVTGYTQKNSLVSAKAKEYNFLPVVIPGYLIIYHDLARGMDNAFTGIPNSLPSVIENEGKYSFDYTLDIPENVSNNNNVSVIVFIMDTKIGSILNACEVRNPTFHPLSGIEENKEKASGELSVYPSADKQSILLEWPAQMEEEIASVQLSGLAGNTVFSATEKIGKTYTIPTNGRKGCYIITLTVKGQTISKKIMLL